MRPNIVLSLCLLLMSCSLVWSQGIGVGAKGGLNLTNIRGDNDNSLRVAYHAGGFILLEIVDPIFIQGDVLLSAQGHDPKTSFDNKLKLLYLNVPIVLGYKITDFIHVHAGPQFGILLSANSEFQGNETDVKDFFKSSDLGGVIGVGVEVFDKISASARYIIGFTNISEGNNSGDRKNGLIQVSVGVKLIDIGR